MLGLLIYEEIKTGVQIEYSACFSLQIPTVTRARKQKKEFAQGPSLLAK
jgi:hypothetical protein